MSCDVTVVTGLVPSVLIAGSRDPVTSTRSTLSAVCTGCCAYASCVAITASAISVATMDDFFANIVRDRLFLLTVLLPKIVYAKARDGRGSASPIAGLSVLPFLVGDLTRAPNASGPASLLWGQ